MATRCSASSAAKIANQRGHVLKPSMCKSFYITMGPCLLEVLCRQPPINAVSTEQGPHQKCRWKKKMRAGRQYRPVIASKFLRKKLKMLKHTAADWLAQVLCVLPI